MPDSPKRVVGTGLLGVSKVWTQVCGLIMLAIAARFLSVEEFGIFAIAAALSMGLNQWVGVGAYEYVIKETGNVTAPSTAFWFNTGMASIFAALGVLVAEPVARLYNSPALGGLVMIMAPLAIPAGWRSVGESILVRRGNLQSAGLAMIVQETIALAVAVWAFASGWGIWSLAFQKVAQFVLGPIVYLSAARWAPRFTINKQDLRAIVRLGTPLTGDRFLAYISGYGADLVLGLALSPVAAGIYRIGVRLVTALQFVLFETLKTRAWSCLTAVAEGGRMAQAAMAERLIGQGWIIAVPVFCGMTLVADLVVAIALGPAWSASATVIVILCGASVGQVVGTVMEPLASINRRASTLLVVRGVTIAATFPLLIAVSPHGAIAIAGVQAAIAIGSCGVSLALQHRLFGVRWHASRVEASVAVLSAAVMACSVLAVRMWLGTLLIDSPAIALAISISAGVATYATAILVARRLFAPALFRSWA